MIDTRKIIVALLFVTICGVLGWFGRASSEEAAPVPTPPVDPSPKPTPVDPAPKPTPVDPAPKPPNGSPPAQPVA